MHISLVSFYKEGVNHLVVGGVSAVVEAPSNYMPWVFCRKDIRQIYISNSE